MVDGEFGIDEKAPNANRLGALTRMSRVL